MSLLPLTVPLHWNHLKTVIQHTQWLCSFTSELCWYFMANTTWFCWSCFIYIFIWFLVSVYYFLSNEESLSSCFRNSFSTKDDWFYFQLPGRSKNWEPSLIFLHPYRHLSSTYRRSQTRCTWCKRSTQPHSPHGRWWKIQQCQQSFLSFNRIIPEKWSIEQSGLNSAVSNGYLEQNCRDPVH